jgi:hypothetical protein
LASEVGAALLEVVELTRAADLAAVQLPLDIGKLCACRAGSQIEIVLVRFELADRRHRFLVAALRMLVSGAVAHRRFDRGDPLALGVDLIVEDL